MNTFTILLLILLIALVIAYFKKDKSLTDVQNQNDKDAIDIEAYKRIVDDRNKARDARREREEAEFTRHAQRESARKSSSHRTNTSWPSEFESSLNSSSLSDYDSVHRSSSSSDYSGGGGSFGGGGSGSSWSDSSSSSSSSSSD